MNVSRCIGLCPACDGDWIIERVMRRLHNQRLMAHLKQGAFRCPSFDESVRQRPNWQLGAMAFVEFKTLTAEAT